MKSIERPDGEKYRVLDITGDDSALTLDRREFLKAAGGGIVILISFGDLLGAEAQEGPGRRRRRGRIPNDFNAFLRIAEDGKVTGYSGKIEMGQGVITSLAQMLADELDAPLADVHMVMGDTGQCPWDQGTWGSRTTRFFGPLLRRAAAEARLVLLELAAKQLGAPRERLKTDSGAVLVEGDPTRRVTYGQLARGRQIQRIVGLKAPLKSPTEFRVMGKATQRTDAVDKATGAAKYAGDIRLPGMLYARIVRPPAHGARLKKIDTSAAEKMAGVRVARDGDLIAVLHETPDGAERALEQVIAEFDVPESEVNDRTIFDHLLRVAPDGRSIAAEGSLEDGEKLASHVVETTYLDGYVAHAPIETHTAVARFEGEKLTVWAATQSPFGARDALVRELRLSEKNVRVITPFVGGGFGGKGRSPQVVEAARIARAAGTPVHLEWTRAEEFFYDSFRPAAVVKVKAGVTDAGKLASWDYAVYFAGTRGARHFYDIPHHRTVAYGASRRRAPNAHPFATGAWRAPANNTNTFARESHIDVMAAKAGKDPLAFRLENLKDKRMRRVLEAAAKRFGWSSGKRPSGRGHGIACGIDSGSYVALMADVEVDKSTGLVEVRRVVCAQDMGTVINPEGAVMQVEGCVTMGLGYALSEDLRFEGGKILDTNFDTYHLPRFSWVPEIETELIAANDLPPQGGGEPAIICMGGLIGNAIHDAVGVRMVQLPMTPERVLAAVKAAG